SAADKEHYRGAVPTWVRPPVSSPPAEHCMTSITTETAVLGIVVTTAAVLDMRTRHTPTWLMLAGLIVGSGAHLTATLAITPAAQPLATALSWTIGEILLGMLLCSIAPLILYRLGAMGGGDVKLLAVVGATLGPVLGLHVALWAFLLAALYAPLRLAYDGQILGLLHKTAALLITPLLPVARKRTVAATVLTSLPFGPAVLAALALFTAQQWLGYRLRGVA